MTFTDEDIPLGDEDAPPEWERPEPANKGEARHALVEAEVAVVGAAMSLAAAAAYEIATGVGISVASFVHPGHRWTWAAIATLYDRGDPITHQTVSTQLAAEDKLERVGGPGMVLSFVAGAAMPGEVPFFARTVTEAAYERTSAALIDEAKGLLGKPRADTAAILTNLKDKIDDLVVHSGRQDTTWRPLDLTDALDGTHLGPETEILTRTDAVALLYPGRTHAFVGEPESGKSWLALLAIAQVLQAGEMAMMIDFEDDQYGIVNRLLAMGVRREAIAERFMYVRPDDPLGAHEDLDLAEALTRNPTLVIIDGVTEAMVLHSWKPKEDIDIAAFQRRIVRRIAGTGPAVVVIDHVVKDKEARGTYATGGQHKKAGIDGAQFNVERRAPWAPGHSGTARITIAKDRPGRIRAACPDLTTVGDLVVTAYPDGGLALCVEPGKAHRPATDGGFRPTHLMERVSAFLAAHADQDHSGSGVRTSVTGNAQAIDRALVVLGDEGYLTLTTVGKARYHRHVKTYIEADDTPTENMEDI